MAEPLQARESGRTQGNEQALLHTLEQLLAIDATELRPALSQATDLLVVALKADKIDVFLYDQAIDTLVALGTSNTAMGRLQKKMGLDRLPLANGGRTVEVFRTGLPYVNGKVVEDTGVLGGIREGLGVRSMMVVALNVSNERRGLVSVCSARQDEYAQKDLQFLKAVSNWVAALVHRTELIERVRQLAVDEARRTTAEQLVTVLAHDLGNRLTPAVGRVDIIRRNARREGNERYLQAADAARNSLMQVHNLTKDLLDVSRLERGLFSLSYSEVDVAALVREIAEASKAVGANISTRVPEKLWIYADQERVRQALENLVGNAVKHSPKGVAVHIEASQEPWRDGEAVVITVSDEGPGIQPELLSKLFTPFSTGPQSTGLGIGLFLAHGIATAHGGALEVDSALHQGTSFCMRLPVSEAA